MQESAVASPYLTAKELAARWKITKHAIYQRAHRGELPYTSFGVSLRFLVSDVERIEREGYKPVARKTRAA